LPVALAGSVPFAAAALLLVGLVAAVTLARRAIERYAMAQGSRRHVATALRMAVRVPIPYVARQSLVRSHLRGGRVARVGVPRAGRRDA
jgi:hypothetical protein